MYYSIFHIKCSLYCSLILSSSGCLNFGYVYFSVVIHFGNDISIRGWCTFSVPIGGGLILTLSIMLLRENPKLYNHFFATISITTCLYPGTYNGKLKEDYGYRLSCFTEINTSNAAFFWVFLIFDSTWIEDWTFVQQSGFMVWSAVVSS